MSTLQEDKEKYLPNAKKLIDFVAKSPSPFHAVESAKQRLVNAGFQQIYEKDSWKGALKPNGKYFFTRNQSAIVAFALGGNWKPGNGFLMIGAHTDSPNLMLKPNYMVESSGFHEIAVQIYGGGLWTTWFDRDLTLAGRVIVKEKEQFVSKLVHIQRPILRIPMLAVHLDRDTGTNLAINKQDHVLPVLATTIKEQLANGPSSKGENILPQLLASELKCDVADIRDWELCVVDTQPPAIGGVYEEFIFSPRLDNLEMTFCSLEALVHATSKADMLANEENAWCVMLFDNEEIGSATAHGADSPITKELIDRVLCDSNADVVSQTIRRSFLISADMAHAIHPNYPGKHEANHKPGLHKGPVVKRNLSGRYATTVETGFLIKEIAKMQNIPLQEFVVRNDTIGGSTIGPIIASNTGIRTMDIGNPQLSMHSIREMGSTTDVTYAIDLFSGFFQHFSKLDASLKTD